MNANRSSQIASGQEVDRIEAIAILNAAVTTSEFRFARNLASAWLLKYHGDLTVDALHAQALLGDGREDLAIPILKRVTNTDPEFLPAQQLLAYAGTRMPFSTNDLTLANLVVLGRNSSGTDLPQWSNTLLNARVALENNNYKEAERLIHQALQDGSDSPLIAVLHLRLAFNNYDWLIRQNLAEQYYDRWPDCALTGLALADALMHSGNEEAAVNLLHQTVNIDLAGQVPTRFWGNGHSYQSLWPKYFSINIDFPIPAAVTGSLGWNQLTTGEPKITPPKAKPTASTAKQADSATAVKSVQKEFERIAARIKNPLFGKDDARFPLYIILSSQSGLEVQYGLDNLAQIDTAMKSVVKANRTMRNWDSYLIYADDPQSTDRFGIPPATSNDPWAIKNFLADLESALQKRGEMIGALLIVGGPKVIPFHRLPNPVDDIDLDVPSDNPYATPDENYFAPRWPVGRLPGSHGKDPSPLLYQLERIALSRSKDRPRLSWLTKLLSKIFPGRKPKLSFGYSAEIWRRASNSVFRPIGKPHTLVISPPTKADHLTQNQRQTSRLAYYNLHGLEDTAEWYGQRDPLESPTGEDYPIALRPQDIVNSGRAPQIVFSEACYGAHIINKQIEDAIALKFLASGTQAVVGSTVTSYGSITTPLIAADLLGKIFWKFLQEGYPAGNALLRAKIELAREMDKRQGYLDGEDQKTLISFIIIGDPLAQIEATGYSGKSSLRPHQNTAEISLVCDRAHPDQEEMPKEIPGAVIKQVKGIVREYLPGMSDARVQVSREHTGCQGDHCPAHHIRSKNIPDSSPSRQVVTLSKQIQNKHATHAHYARITLDDKGEVVKLAVSR